MPITKTQKENDESGSRPLGRSSTLGTLPEDTSDDFVSEGWTPMREVTPGLAKHEWEAVLAYTESQEQTGFEM
jgi:hypothetical protein